MRNPCAFTKKPLSGQPSRGSSAFLSQGGRGEEGWRHDCQISRRVSRSPASLPLPPFAEQGGKDDDEDDEEDEEKEQDDDEDEEEDGFSSGFDLLEAALTSEITDEAGTLGAANKGFLCLRPRGREGGELDD